MGHKNLGGCCRGDDVVQYGIETILADYFRRGFLNGLPRKQYNVTSVVTV